MRLKKRLVMIFLSFLAASGIAIADKGKEPGNIISSEQLADRLGLSQSSEQYRITYTSIDGVMGGIREDSGAVFLPKGKVPEGGWPVIVWNHGTVGIATKCAPSLNPKTGSLAQYLNTWLSLGYAIVAPDYPGLGSSGLHHYMDEKSTAWSSLDSAKAALKKYPLKNQLVFIGQSQGAHAAFAAAGWQPQYAPELNLVGVVSTGTPYFEKSMFESFVDQDKNDTGDRKLPYAMYLYLSAADKDPELNIGDYFQEAAILYVEKAKSLCIGSLSEMVMDNHLNASNSLKPNLKALSDKEITNLAYNTLYINKPVFIGIGLSDIHVLTKWQQEFAADVLAAGTQALVKEYLGIGHLDIYNVSLRDSVPFVLKITEEANKIDSASH